MGRKPDVFRQLVIQMKMRNVLLEAALPRTDVNAKKRLIDQILELMDLVIDSEINKGENKNGSINGSETTEGTYQATRRNSQPVRT